MKRAFIMVVAALILTSVAICIQAACPCARPEWIASAVAGQTDPLVSTDRPDYSPGETVKISGSGFSPAALLQIRVTRPDGSRVTGDGSFKPWPTDYDNVVADVRGELVYAYVLDGIEGEYVVEVLGPYGTVLAACTFTDGGAITGVTLMYPGQVGTHVTVPPGASIAAIVAVQTYDEEYDASVDWEGTQWLIANSPLGPGGAWPWGTCVDHENHVGAGSYAEVLTMTAPMLAGTYNVYFYVSHCDYFGVPISQYRPCSFVFDDFQLSGAVEVECTPPSISSPSDIAQVCDPGACGAGVAWTAPTAVGNPPPTVVCSPSLGSFFPVGETTVTCTATNTCGTDTTYFTVVVPTCISSRTSS